MCSLSSIGAIQRDGDDLVALDNILAKSMLKFMNVTAQQISCSSISPEDKTLPLNKPFTFFQSAQISHLRK